MTSTDLKVVISSDTVEIESESEIQPGQWWWYYEGGVPGGELQKAEADESDADPEDDDEDDDEEFYDDEDEDEAKGDPVLVCVMKIGSNYIKVKTVRGGSWRQAQESWYDHFTRARDADEHISGKQEHFRVEIERLLAEVQEITRRLGVSKQAQLSPEQTTQALVLQSEGSSYDEYKGALVKAQDKTIPDIYNQMKRTNEALRDWLTAPTLPMSVMVTDQSEIIDSIKRRVFNVELYAGLCESVTQFADGEPALMGDKLHLMQRRCYMDEECLVAYKTGGMSFGSIREFDDWLAQPENRDRVLPFPRCMVSFRVRRHGKEFDGYSIYDFIRFRDETFNDKRTYLYIRNGEQLYCLETDVEFGERLFPDLDHSVFSSGEIVYARKDWREFQFMTEGEWLTRIDDLAERRVKVDIERAAWEKEQEAWEAMSEEGREGKKEPSHFGPHRPHDYEHLDEYKPFNPENLYYDDILEHIKKEAEEYNRISLIIQGLFDRSETLHPHPKVRTWTTDGFEAAVELHFDDSQALTDGDPPDFDAYRAKLNENLGTGCNTVGQQHVFDAFVKEKESDRGRYGRYHDYGEGPGEIAAIAQWKPRARKAVFRWKQSTHWNSGSDSKSRRIEVESKDILNIDAYTPGDFRQFYNDPRTRANYARWAYFLLLAEEFHAGNVDESGRVVSKANVNHCDRCGEDWWRSHSCKGRKKRKKKRVKCCDDPQIVRSKSTGKRRCKNCGMKLKPKKEKP